MKRKFALTLIAVAIGVALGSWLYRRAAPGTAGASAPKPTVAIQDRKTIDFSSGKPVVKDSKQEQAIIDSAVKEMDEAAKSVHFDPPPSRVPDQPSAEPAPAPPKK